MRQLIRCLILGIGLAMLSACGDTPADIEEVQISPTAPSVTPRVEATADSQPTPLPTTPVVDSPAALRVWWPDELFPVENSTAEDILAEQLDGFRDTYSNFGLEVRHKRSSGLGGILSTLRTAAPVAPAAMPDLVLMQRADMITAASEGLIIPMDNWVSSDILEHLPDYVQPLGEIDGILYGLPYALNLYHVAYRGALLPEPLLTFDAVLEEQPKFRFPAGVEPGNAVNWTVLLQYLAAGGRLVDENNNPILDQEPLERVLSYYATGLEAEIFDSGLLTATQFDSYWNSFVSGETSIICVDSRTYLRHKDGVPNVGLAPIPTDDGTALSALEGWMWVVTTHDPDRQDQARTFLAWMMRLNAQAVYLEALGMLPSQDGALSLWDDQQYAAFAQEMLPQAVIIPPAQRNNSAAAALQLAVASVLNGTPAEEAVAEAVAKFEPVTEEIAEAEVFLRTKKRKAPTSKIGAFWSYGS